MDSRTIRYPSEELKAFPPFEITCPSGWLSETAPGCIGVLFDASHDGEFRANIIIGVDRLSRDIDLEAVTEDSLRDATASLIEFRSDSEKLVTIGGQPAAVRFQSLLARPGDVELVQMQVLFFAPADSVTHDLIRIHATCLAVDAERYVSTFVGTARSFQFLARDAERSATA